MGFVLLVTVLVDLALLVAGAEYHHYTVLVLSTMQLLALVRGTQAHIKGSDSTVVYVDIY